VNWKYIAVVLGIFLATVARSSAKESNTHLQFLQTAEITNVDLKNHVLKVRDPLSNSSLDVPIGRSNQNGYGKRGRRSGLKGPAGSVDPDLVGEFKVTVTDDTVIKDGTIHVAFSALQAGEHILIKGTLKDRKGDFLASEISLLPSAPHL